MGSKISPTTIGAFVVGAIVLVVAGALLFGGGKFFQEKLPYVMFFDSSVGLNVGAPVIFRGVQVGQVTEFGHRRPPDVRYCDQGENRAGAGSPQGGGEWRAIQGPATGVSRTRPEGGPRLLAHAEFCHRIALCGARFPPGHAHQADGPGPGVSRDPYHPLGQDQLKATFQEVMADLRKLPLESLLGEVIRCSNASTPFWICRR